MNILTMTKSLLKNGKFEFQYSGNRIELFLINIQELYSLDCFIYYGVSKDVRFFFMEENVVTKETLDRFCQDVLNRLATMNPAGEIHV